MRPIHLLLTLACLLPLGYLVADLTAQQPQSPRKPGARLAVGITPEREAAAVTFVERNHPELVDLLELLKTNQPQEYERAIRELHRVTEKLAQVQERDSQLYDLELLAWQVHSRIQLLTAKAKMPGNDRDHLREELRQAIGEQFDARAALLSHERQRVAGRLAKIDKDLERLQGDRQQLVERQFNALTNPTAGLKNKKGPAGKNIGAASRSDRGEKRKQSKTSAAQPETNFKSKP